MSETTSTGYVAMLVLELSHRKDQGEDIQRIVWALDYICEQFGYFRLLDVCLWHKGFVGEQQSLVTWSIHVPKEYWDACYEGFREGKSFLHFIKDTLFFPSVAALLALTNGNRRERRIEVRITLKAPEPKLILH